jgi:hypothetical protein
MKNKHLLFILVSCASFLGTSCKKNNGNPPLVINNGREEIFYSRDTTNTMAYQCHLTYNTNGSVDILRNSVGFVHASSANEIVTTGIQTTVVGNTAKAVLLSGKQYWLIPFQPGLAPISLSSADTAIYTCSCSGATIGGPCQLIALLNPPQPAWISTNPHGCPSNSVTITTHSNNYSFIGGAVLLQAAVINVKK